MKYINEYSSYERNLFNKVSSKPEIFVANVIKNLEIKYIDEYPDSTFFVHKTTGKIWMEDNKKTGYLYVSKGYIWSKIKYTFPYNEQQIKDLIKYTVETGFKIKVGTPWRTGEL